MQGNQWRRVLNKGWVTWVGPVLIAAWLLAAITLTVRRYDTFWTSAFDQAFDTNVVWNTAQGRFFVNQLKPPTLFLADHFAALLAVVAPIFWVWPDGRALLAAKAVMLGLSIVPSYVLLRTRYPRLAPILVACFCLNPSVYQTLADVGDFHELLLAVATVTLAVYALVRERRLLLWEALALTLLVREDMGMYVVPFGLFVLLFRPKWRWTGAGLMLMGAAWTVLVFKFLRPMAGATNYSYLAGFASANPAWAAIAAGRLPALQDLAAVFFTEGKLRAVWGIVAPMALLPLLSNTGAQLLWVPAALVLMAVPGWRGALGQWYLAPLLPLWWGTIAMTLVKLPDRLAKGALALLVAATLVGAWVEGPLNRATLDDLARYQLTTHDRLGPAFLAQVPPDAAVVAQNGLLPHLATRTQLRMFPWYKHDVRPQLIVVDLKGKDLYPYISEDRTAFVKDVHLLQLDPTIRLAQEQDGYMILAMDQNPPQAPHQGPWQWTPYLELEGYALAQTDATKAFRLAPFTPAAGRTLRVELYWTALAPMTADYKISVVVAAADGYILAQNDARPGQEVLHTPDWAVGRTIRDTHYIDLPEPDLPSPLSLGVVVYDAATMQRLAPGAGAVLTTDLASVQSR